jgi:hypothetical protein
VFRRPCEQVDFGVVVIFLTFNLPGTLNLPRPGCNPRLRRCATRSTTAWGSSKGTCLLVHWNQIRAEIQTAALPSSHLHQPNVQLSPTCHAPAVIVQLCRCVTRSTRSWRRSGGA